MLFNLVITVFLFLSLNLFLGFLKVFIFNFLSKRIGYKKEKFLSLISFSHFFTGFFTFIIFIFELMIVFQMIALSPNKKIKKRNYKNLRLGLIKKEMYKSENTDYLNLLGKIEHWKEENNLQLEEEMDKEFQVLYQINFKSSIDALSIYV